MKAFCLILVLFLKSSFVCSQDYSVSSFHLVNGTSPNEGRVEVTVLRDGRPLLIRGVMSSEYDEGWTVNTANWVCQQLSYLEAAFWIPGSRFGSGQPRKVFSFESGGVDLECDNEELESCYEEEAAGVICQKPGYLGCYRIDKKRQDRIMIREIKNGIRSNLDCLVLCRNGETLFAAQMGDMCLCFNDSDDGLAEKLNQEVCGTSCTENDKQRCGGGKDIYTIFNVSTGFCPEISGNNLNVYGRYRFGDIVRANCSGGLRLMGDDILQCIGGPDSYYWNGSVPKCIDATTVQPRATDDPATMDPARTELTGRTTITRAGSVPRTGTERITDATTAVGVTLVTDARSVSKSLAVKISVSVVGVVIVAVLAILLVLFIVRTRRSKSEMKQDIQPTSPKSNFSNTSYSMQNIPNNEGPSYYEVGPNVATEGTNGLIDNVLYKPVDNIRREPNEYVLAQDPSSDTPHYGLVDNVLYKPVENIADPHSNNHKSDSSGDTSRDNHASDNSRQLPNDSEYHYASPDEIESRGRDREGELIDNILYKSTDSPVQVVSASRKYYEIKPGSVDGHHTEADHPSSDNGARYYDIQPQPRSYSPPPSNFENYNPGSGYDTTDLETTGDNGPRFVIKTEHTSPMIHEYAAVDNNDGITSRDTSNSTAAAAAVKQKPFPRYAKVQK